VYRRPAWRLERELPAAAAAMVAADAEEVVAKEEVVDSG